MRKLLVGTLLVFTLSLFGCSGAVSGTVAEKRHDSGYVTTTLIYTGETFIPMSMYYPESWHIKVGDVWISVDEETFSEVEIGDEYDELG